MAAKKNKETGEETNLPSVETTPLEPLDNQALTEKLTELLKAHDVHVKTVEGLKKQLDKAQNDHAETVEYLEEQLKETKSLAEELLKANSHAEEQNKLLRAKLKTATTIEDEKPEKETPIAVPSGTFEVDGKAYRFRFAKTNDGKGNAVPSAVILENQDEYQHLLKKLVKNNSGLIIEV